MIRGLLAILVACLFTGGTVSAQDYLIQPGDRLDVTVLEDPGLNRQVLVRPDGKFSMPLAGTVTAGNRTLEAVEAAIRRALSGQFVQPPTVSVALSSLGQPSLVDGEASVIYVVGEVNQPGRYEVVLPMDALQALALSGGPGTFAARKRIQIRRTVNGAESVFLFDYDAVQRGVVPFERIGLVDGDVIVVPERGLFE